MLAMQDLHLTGKRVIIREDFNVPLFEGHITNDTRIKAAIPTITAALHQGAAIILLSHLGRPHPGTVEPQLSLAPIANQLAKLLQKPVHFVPNWLDGFHVQEGEIYLCENVRFLIGETTNDDALAKKMASLGDIFVMDAFGSAHRAHASTHGIARFIPVACAGPLLIQELAALKAATHHAATPLLAIIGGAKISSKLTLLTTLCQKFDYLICGGGIANTLLAATQNNVGRSLYESNLLPAAQEILMLARQNDCEIPLPIDVVVADQVSNTAHIQIKPISAVTHDDIILDIGPKTSNYYCDLIKQSRTIMWNGPVGVFEIEAFSHGTRSIATAIATHDAYSIAGGGDTIAALDKFGVYNTISYVSTGGGAFLEYLEGKNLPAIEILNQRAREV